MIISPSSLDTNLSQLLDEVNSGKTQLPEFQRDWTWDDNRIRGIIASLSQGYPMGAIMRLQHGNPDIKFKYRTIKGVGQRDLTPDFLVLDGQQRLTSIYQSTYSQNPVATKTDKEGHIIGKNCKGEEKVKRLASTIPNAQIVTSYSDSESDLPILNLAKTAYVVEGNKLIPYVRGYKFKNKN